MIRIKRVEVVLDGFKISFLVFRVKEGDWSKRFGNIYIEEVYR